MSVSYNLRATRSNVLVNTTYKTSIVNMSVIENKVSVADLKDLQAEIEAFYERLGYETIDQKLYAAALINMTTQPNFNRRDWRLATRINLSTEYSTQANLDLMEIINT